MIIVTRPHRDNDIRRADALKKARNIFVSHVCMRGGQAEAGRCRYAPC